MRKWPSKITDSGWYPHRWRVSVNLQRNPNGRVCKKLHSDRLTRIVIGDGRAADGRLLRAYTVRPSPAPSPRPRGLGKTVALYQREGKRQNVLSDSEGVYAGLFDPINDVGISSAQHTESAALAAAIGCRACQPGYPDPPALRRRRIDFPVSPSSQNSSGPGASLPGLFFAVFAPSETTVEHGFRSSLHRRPCHSTPTCEAAPRSAGNFHFDSDAREYAPAPFDGHNQLILRCMPCSGKFLCKRSAV
jgi:hypothetical protein